jgi:hypothetical protein
MHDDADRPGLHGHGFGRRRHGNGRNCSWLRPPTSFANFPHGEAELDDVPGWARARTSDLYLNSHVTFRYDEQSTTDVCKSR